MNEKTLSIVVFILAFATAFMIFHVDPCHESYCLTQNPIYGLYAPFLHALNFTLSVLILLRVKAFMVLGLASITVAIAYGSYWFAFGVTPPESIEWAYPAYPSIVIFFLMVITHLMNFIDKKQDANYVADDAEPLSTDEEPHLESLKLKQTQSSVGIKSEP